MWHRQFSHLHVFFNNKQMHPQCTNKNVRGIYTFMQRTDLWNETDVSLILLVKLHCFWDSGSLCITKSNIVIFTGSKHSDTSIFFINQYTWTNRRFSCQCTIPVSQITKNITQIKWLEKKCPPNNNTSCKQTQTVSKPINHRIKNF